MILENVLGHEHPDVAVNLNRLAELYRSLGDYTKAEPLYKRALAIDEKNFGAEHPYVAGDLNNLAVVYQSLGEYEKAESLYKRALAIQEKFLGSEHPDMAVSLNNLAELYRSFGDYTKAEPLYKQALAIDEKILGPEHLNVAVDLNNLAVLYQSLGEYEKAEPLYKRTLAIQEKNLGPEHPDVAASLDNLAQLYHSCSEYTRAEPLYQRALRIKEKALGEKHPAVATSLNNLALLYQARGEYEKAEPLYKRALTISEKSLGPEHPDVAICLDNLAQLYHSRGEYARAEPLYQRALRIEEKAFGSEHPDVAKTLNNLAQLYHFIGEYDKAEPLFQKALKIYEKAFGKEHPEVAKTSNNLAVLYYSLGKYEKAEPLYKRALAIQEKVLGLEHPDVAKTLNNLASLNYSIGSYDQAESFYKKALAILEKSLGAEHPYVATNLNNLARLYHELGKYAQAKPLYQRALAIDKKVFGPEHPDVAIDLNNLAMLYDDLGEYTQVEPLLKQALAIREKALGPEHPAVATSLNNLSMLYISLGEYVRAEPLLKQSLAIDKKILGPEHPDVAIDLNNLALLYAILDDVEKSHNLFHQAQQIDEKLIDQVMGFTSEAQKLGFLATKKWDLHAFLCIVSQHLAQNVSARKDALDIWLRRKGVILEAQKRFQEALIYSDDPEAVKTFQELARVRAQLSRLAFAEPGKEDPEAYKQRIAELRDQKDQLEVTLSRLSQAYAVKQKIAKADVETVVNALPADTVLIELARVQMFNFKAKHLEDMVGSAHYLAFVLHAGSGEKVGMIDLGNAERIDTEIATFKNIINSRNPTNPQAIDVARRLYQLVFAQLKAELGDVREIFISPDGNLNLIPFEVLVGPDGQFLIEDYTFNYLAAGRDILGFGEIKEKGGNPVLMGDPDFDFLPTPDPSQERNDALRGHSTQEGALASLSSEPGGLAPGMSRSADMRGFQFNRLPGTKEEVETIYELLKGTSSPPPDLPHQGGGIVRLYTDKAAREEALLQTEAPRILHLATHGFFLEDQDLSVFVRDDPFRSSDIYFKPRPQPVFTDGSSIPAQFENPLLRSGIALAGANTATGEEGHAEGIVTAEKILGLKLRGTEMVVLSACETGLGDVQVGEGVYGLRRAFLQAGAKSLVMSLWKVPDKETKDLMVRFYTHLLSGQMTRVQALRQAAVEMKKEKPHPYYWGAFVFLGEP